MKLNKSKAKKFTEALQKLLVEHGIYLRGIIDIEESDEVEAQLVSIAEKHRTPLDYCFSPRDTVVFKVEYKEEEEVVEREEFLKAPQINSFQSFVSPIDKKVISSRSQLKAHEREHGVIQVGDAHEGYVKQKHEEAKEKKYEKQVEDQYQVKWS